MALHWLRASRADSKGMKASSFTTLPNRLRSVTEFLTDSVFWPISSRPWARNREYPEADSYCRLLCSECLVVDWLVLPEFQFQRPAFLCSSMMKTKPEDEGTKRRRRERKKGGFGYELMSYDRMNDHSDSVSSGSESEGAGASAPAISTKEKLVGSEVNIEHNRNDLGDPDSGNHLLNGSNQVDEQNSEDKVVAIETEGSQEGENTPLGRQVSPDKLYRAALLKSRFADTILKAQEKTLEKGEKQDPERLRLEREELERRRKEEKARLQAEAKAAEEARRKAAAAAAAEAKRKRELEREAARQALQKMEKTVDINENSQFIEDLEMLSAAPSEHLQSFVDDATPDLSQDGLGSLSSREVLIPWSNLVIYEDGQRRGRRR
ncbi:transcription factor GTE10-like [Actinidia eriantha]|uniref:transcription factor GTE10-like n=1 Tax=Actinidia eriantha TaxID=165200 RepID=UPI00258CBA79|nr:transcription factor GTE10-like [Actinidia eriantha]